MRKALLFFVVVLSTALLPASAQDAVLFATGEWAPYVSESLPDRGASYEMVMAICAAAGIQAQIKFYPWVRAESMVESGKAFAAFPYAFSEERKSKYLFSDITHYGANAFIFYSGNSKTPLSIADVDPLSLKSYVIGVTNGSFLHEELEKLGYVVDDGSITIDNAVRMLEAGRIDFFVDEVTVAFDSIVRLFPANADRFARVKKTLFAKMPNGLIVSKTYPNAQAILAKFNAGLAAIKKSGVYQKIAKEHHLTVE